LATGVTSTAPTLQRLLENGYDIKAVVVHNEPTVSRKQRTQEVVTLAEHNHIPVLAPDKLRDIEDELKSYQATVGVLAAFGKIVPQSIINIFPAGIVNIHPSLLPLHRGPTPLESVMLDGSPKTGVSLMQLVKEMDAGPVYAYSEYELTGTESKQELANDLGSLGASMLTTLLPRIITGEVAGMPQEESKATYDKLIAKEAGILDWRKPAERLEREIRAYAEWPKCRTILGEHAVIVTQAHPENGTGNPGQIWRHERQLGVHCVDGILVLDRLKPAGKGEMTAEAFLNGYGKDL
jgi:methionyl-tRNA formyltransferase